MSQINTRIVLRNDTAANWELVKTTATLLVGEMGIETDTGLFKIGKMHPTENRLCTWEELEYANDIPDVDLSTVTNNVKEATTLEGLGNGMVVGDVGIVKAPLFEGADEYTYTGYVWNGTAWAAMDGNYSAENVFTSRKITLAGDYGKDSRKDAITTIGNKKIGDSFEAGMSIQSILMDILSKRIQPGNATAPSVSWTTNPTATKEVGSKVTPSYGAKLNAGSYTYGPATGITPSSWEVTIADTGEAAKSTASGSFNEITITDGMSGYAKITAKATYEGSAADPVDNLGDVATNAADVKIPGGSKSATANGYTGYRAWFWGYKKGADKVDVSALTSAQIRGLDDYVNDSNNPNATNGTFPTTMATSLMQQMFFAAPAGKVKSIAVEHSVNGAPQTVKQTTVYVKGANDYVVDVDPETNADNNRNGMKYDVFYVSNDNANTGDATYKITVTKN